MFLKKLTLQNFRCFKKKTFEFSKQTTLIVGPNAIGKTNVLEAIYLLATGKSFRAGKEVEMINYGEEVARVNGQLSDEKNLEILLTNGEVQGKRTRGKLYKINGVGKMWRDFAGNLKCVLFRPEDIDLISGSPSIRRDYLDLVLEQVDWQYRVCNLAYKKGLRQRNRLLKSIREGKGKRAQLTFWNQLLIKNGQIVTKKREELIEFFNDFLANKTRSCINIEYDRSTITEQRLEKYAAAELAFGATLVGPQRDDVQFRIKNQESRIKKVRNLALFGSRGEQRMAVLYIKMAEMEFITKKSGQKPVLLLDDIFSELDEKHRKLVVKIIDSCQVIITSTEVEKDIKILDIKRLES